MQTRVAAERTVTVFEYRCGLAKGAPVEPEQFTRPAISIVTSGVFGFRSTSVDQLLTTGSVLLANPGQQYEISHEHQGGDRCLIFRFDEAALDDVLRQGGHGSRTQLFERSVLPPLPRIDAIKHLVERRLAEGGAELGLEELGLALAACAFEHAGGLPRLAKAPATRSRQTRERIFRALEALKARANDDVQLTELADVSGLSPFHFLRQFKRETGSTPYQYLLKLRLRHAVTLLRDTQRPVTDIAFEVGFGDLSNFINTFRRELGCSPAAFRKLTPEAWAAEARART
jgi:AraC family transcriptional regulator